jgi:hypothetical protein
MEYSGVNHFVTETKWKPLTVLFHLSRNRMAKRPFADSPICKSSMRLKPTQNISKTHRVDQVYGNMWLFLE